MIKARLIFAATGLVVATMLTAGSIEIRAQTTSHVPADAQDAAVQQQESMSALATKVLHQIVEARAAIHAGEPKRAEGELQTALALIERIKAVRPSTGIANHIWVAERQLDYQAPREVALTLIPIEISLTDLKEVFSVQRAKRHLQEAKSHLDRDDAEAARKELGQLRNSLAQTEVDLPLTSTEQHIGRAFAQLAEGRPDEANRSLEQAEAGVRFVSLGTSAPLAMARRALWQAIEDYSAGHDEAVEAGLKRAQGWLEQVETGTDAETQREVQRLRTEINELLEREAHKTPEAEPELTGLWHRSMGLVERRAEKLYHAWRDQQFENHIFALLISAKMHFYYAEHALFESGDAEDAREELGKAARYLHTAAAEVSGDRMSQIDALEKEVTDLARLADNPSEVARDRYDAVMEQLRQMLHEI